MPAIEPLLIPLPFALRFRFPDDAPALVAEAPPALVLVHDQVPVGPAHPDPENVQLLKLKGPPSSPSSSISSSPLPLLLFAIEESRKHDCKR